MEEDKMKEEKEAEIEEEAEAVELVLFQVSECYVYMIPPRITAASYRADEWNVNKWTWAGILKVVSKGVECIIRLEDKTTGELYARAFLRDGEPHPVEAVIDSSRYFVLRVEENIDGRLRHAFIGIGFRERSEAYDFQAALHDHMKYLNKKKTAEEMEYQYQHSSSVDYSLKDGETLVLQLKKKEGGSIKSKFFEQRLNNLSLEDKSKNKETSVGWKDNFRVILGSDQVEAGKPAPDLFLEAAKGMGVDSSCCLVFEDSIVGVKAGKAAKMNVVAVPSLQNESNSYSIADSILHSLLEFQPEQWGLPQFNDWVGNALPIEHILLTGLLSNGFFQAYADNGLCDLPSQIWGLYIGWAQLDGQVLKAVISIGWKLSCCGSRRIIQPCLVDGSQVENYDHRMQLLLVGYLRRSCSVGNVLYSPEIIDEDREAANAALNLPAFSHNIFED